MEGPGGSIVEGNVLELGCGRFTNYGPAEPRTYPFFAMLAGRAKALMSKDSINSGNQGSVVGVDLRDNEVDEGFKNILLASGLGHLAPWQLYQHVEADLSAFLNGEEELLERVWQKLEPKIRGEGFSLVSMHKLVHNPYGPLGPSMTEELMLDGEPLSGYINYISVAPEIRSQIFAAAQSSKRKRFLRGNSEYREDKFYPEVAGVLEVMGQRVINAVSSLLVEGGVWQVNWHLYRKVNGVLQPVTRN